MPASRAEINGRVRRLLVGFVLDSSGSMAFTAEETINGINQQFEVLRKSDDAANTFVCAWTFNSGVKPLYTQEKDNEVVPSLVATSDLKDLKLINYIPSGCTAMYDGVGDAIAFLSQEATALDDIMVIVASDGAENASQRFTAQQIASQVTELQEDGWNFTYIGANQDLTQVQKTLHFSQGNIVQWEQTHTGTSAAYGVVGSMLDNYTEIRSQKLSTDSTARTNSKNLYTSVSDPTAPSSIDPEVVTASSAPEKEA